MRLEGTSGFLTMLIHIVTQMGNQAIANLERKCFISYNATENHVRDVIVLDPTCVAAPPIQIVLSVRHSMHQSYPKSHVAVIAHSVKNVEVIKWNKAA